MQERTIQWEVSSQHAGIKACIMGDCKGKARDQARSCAKDMCGKMGIQIDV